jgi:hypothetical protein
MARAVCPAHRIVVEDLPELLQPKMPGGNRVQALLAGKKLLGSLRAGLLLIRPPLRQPVLNGHIHQTMEKVEGRVVFHTAMSTAFPQPEPGKAPKTGPMKVDASKLRERLGITDINFVEGETSLAIVDSALV